MDYLTIFHHVPVTAVFMVAYLRRDLKEILFLINPLGLEEDIL
jgi:hypothetical protein